MRQPERQIHIDVCEHLRRRSAPNLFWFHPANGGKRNIIDAVNLKRMGVVPGVPDLVAIHRGKFYGLELKTAVGRPTEAQLEAMDRINMAGGYTCIARGFDEAIKALLSWGLIR